MSLRPVRALGAEVFVNYDGQAKPKAVIVDDANTLAATTTSTHIDRVLTQDSTYVTNNVVLGDHPAGFAAPGELTVRFVVYNQQTAQTNRAITTTPAEDNVVWFVMAGSAAAVRNEWNYYSQTLDTPLTQRAGAGTDVYFNEVTSEFVVGSGVWLVTCQVVMSSVYDPFSYWVEDAATGDKLTGFTQTTLGGGIGTATGVVLGPRRMKIKWAGTPRVTSNQPFRVSFYIKRISSNY